MTTGQITAADAGCWLDGSQGWHNTYRVIDRAVDLGWHAGDSAARAEVLALARAYEADSTTADAEAVHDAAGEATDYLNSIAPAGYVFEWDCGELTLHADDDAIAGYTAEFVAGYCEAMLWASTRIARPGDDDDYVLDGDVHPQDWQTPGDGWQLAAFTPASQASITTDCENFIAGNWADLQGWDAAQAGHDFALTRNRHGTGFWDRGHGATGDRLTEAAHTFGESTATVDGEEYDAGHALARLDGE